MSQPLRLPTAPDVPPTILGTSQAIISQAALRSLTNAARPGKDTDGRKPPWTWANLNTDEAQALDGAIDEFIDMYNRVHAGTEAELIPPCWRRHPALSQELPVQYWSWWAAHIDSGASVLVAMEYYSRHLPAFQGRIVRLLGSNAVQCRKGTHTESVDHPVQAQIDEYKNVDQALVDNTPASLHNRQRRQFGTLPAVSA